jgi:hypothetical protein
VNLTLIASLTWTLDGDKNSFTPRLPYYRRRILFEASVNYYTETTERRPAVYGDDPSRRFQFLPVVFLSLVFFHVAKAKAIVASEGYHVSIHINNDMNRTSRYLKGDMLKYVEDGSVEEVDPWEFFPWPQYNEVNV